MLPKSLSPDHLLSKEWPGDLTLGRAKEAMKKMKWYKELSGMTKGRVRIRFLYNDGKEAPDTMTFKEMRRLVSKGELTVAIDDGQGGIPVEA